MVRELIHDPLLLGRKSEKATKEDLQIAVDLADTLQHHRQSCVGMAANMIGEHKCIIAFFDNEKLTVLFNPVIIKAWEPYETQESCLSLLGGPRKTVRYQKIKLQYQTQDMQQRIKTFAGFTAQIIQHETDHCNGILI